MNKRGGRIGDFLPLLFILLFILSNAVVCGYAQANERRLRVAVLDFGTTETARRATDKLSRALFKDETLRRLDREESRAAARGAGYGGSLNMTLAEARDLGGALGCDFFLTGDAQTLRRSPSSAPVYYEAYASVFIISSRTGRLILWDRPSFEAASSDEAEKSLLDELNVRAARYVDAIKKAEQLELSERAEVIASATALVAHVIEDAPDDESIAVSEGLRLPHPYRRLRPIYPDTAARAEVTATVDVQLEIDAKGEVSRAEITRWAGFGLDEATLNTVRQLHFRPAMRGGVSIPIRILLRYNFRKPPK
jgi:TonB family protein